MVWICAVVVGGMVGVIGEKVGVMGEKGGAEGERGVVVIGGGRAVCLKDGILRYW